MKKLQMTAMALGIATVSLFSFKDVNTATVKGTVSPAEGATQAWALSTSDTVKEAMVVPDICPREAEFCVIMNSIKLDLP